MLKRCAALMVKDCMPCHRMLGDIVSEFVVVRPREGELAQVERVAVLDLLYHVAMQTVLGLVNAKGSRNL
jgi:hypothetical protein